MKKKKKSNKKGMTVVETVVAFVIMALAFTIGMIGIATGANFINSGARLKQSRSDVASQIEAGASGTTSTITVSASDGSTVGTYSMDEYIYDNFKAYKSSSTTP